MTTKPLTLMDAAALLRDLPTEEAVAREDLQLFIERVEIAGKNILEAKGGGDYLEEASIMIMSGVMAELISNPDPSNVSLFMTMQKHFDAFQLILGYAFIYAVGLGVVEELY
jgi:malate/lactate dehydrogenase